MAERTEKLREPGGYEAEAIRYLERARKELNRAENRGTAETDDLPRFFLSSANVLALLELARAVREGSQPRNGTD